MVVERRAEVGSADQVEPIRLVDGVFDLLRRQLRREVDEDRDGIGNGDATDEAGRADVGASVQTDPGSLMEDRTRHPHVNRTAALGPQSPQGGGAAMTQLGIVATCQRRRLETTELTDVRSADGVDTSPEGM
jgi:hypothetical protein